eukprot:773908-Pelagomonas_calceolata.AAC.3
MHAGFPPAIPLCTVTVEPFLNARWLLPSTDFFHLWAALPPRICRKSQGQLAEMQQGLALAALCAANAHLWLPTQQTNAATEKTLYASSASLIQNFTQTSQKSVAFPLKKPSPPLTGHRVPAAHQTSTAPPHQDQPAHPVYGNAQKQNKREGCIGLRFDFHTYIKRISAASACHFILMTFTIAYGRRKNWHEEHAMRGKSWRDD